MPDVFGGSEKQCGRVSKGIQYNNLDVKILTSRQKFQSKRKEVAFKPDNNIEYGMR